MNEDMRDLERKSRAAFDESVASLDAATRLRLARARTRALEQPGRRRLARAALWLPAGAAAAALVAAMLWQREDGGAPPDAEFLEFLGQTGGEDEDFVTLMESLQAEQALKRVEEQASKEDDDMN